MSIAYRSLPPPLPIHFPPPSPLFRPSIAEGWCPSCVHYKSLGGWGIESLGFSVSVVLKPMSASLSPSLRADYGGALNRCVAPPRPVPRPQKNLRDNINKTLAFTPSANRKKHPRKNTRHALLLPPQRHPPQLGTPIFDSMAFHHHRLLPTPLRQ
eukprot:scaffold8737_cov124-Isochrysis_galbana.AAC.4